jgi:GNAT superfamily N-acetyltransferase
VRAVQLSDATEFLERARPLLLADEARHNLILGLAATLRDQPDLYPEHMLWLVEAESLAVGAALQTPPYRLVLARPARPGVLEKLAEAIDDLPGVVAAHPEVDDFATAWTSKTGAAVRTGMAQGIYALEHVVPPQQVSGAARPASGRDRELLRAWLSAFVVEGLGEGTVDPVRVERMLEQRLDAGPESGLVLWEDGGEPVSLTGFGPSTPTGTRIGPVYTPPELRRRGYASALVAHVSQERLDAGRRFCFLYTDLTNPTSNRIYVALGYERVCDSLELEFVHPS